MTFASVASNIVGWVIVGGKEEPVLLLATLEPIEATYLFRLKYSITGRLTKLFSSLPEKSLMALQLLLLPSFVSSLPV